MVFERRNLHQVGDAGKSSALSPQNDHGQESSSGQEVRKSVVQYVAVEFFHQNSKDKPLIKPEINEYGGHVPLGVIYPPCKDNTKTNEVARHEVDKNGDHGNAVARHKVQREGGHGYAVARNEIGRNGDYDNVVVLRHDVGRNGGRANAMARNRHDVGRNGGHGNIVARRDIEKNGDNGNAMTRREVWKNSDVDASPQFDIEEGHGVPDTGNLEVGTSSAEPTQNFEIASSLLGEVQSNLSWNFANRFPNFHAPSVEDVLKRIEDKHLHSYTIEERKKGFEPLT